MASFERTSYDQRNDFNFVCPKEDETILISSFPPRNDDEGQFLVCVGDFNGKSTHKNQDLSSQRMRIHSSWIILVLSHFM
mmetsp:Transcript_8402/g.13003  ORF Transcript_8402/g.13003 Transcript_8402/m.13003 type:complete len:80 (+) Transcript_8402:996-1235(+)